MRILLIDATSSFLDFALRCEAAGHEVRVFMGPTKRGDRSTVGDGLITRVADYKPSMQWADLILTSDNAKYIRELEGFRARGFPIWGSNSECTAWELDRDCGQRVLETAGIATIPSHCFSNYDKAAEFVRSTLKRYVSKPSGDADKALSYVSKGPADLIFMLERWKSSLKSKAPFLLQEFIPGIEMAVGGWVGRNGFSRHFLENFEFKKLMNGEIGVNTGEMGTAMRYVSAEDSKLVREMLLPLEAELIRCGYTGFIDVSVIIDKKGQPWPLEFTTRPGWPLFQIQQALHPEPCEWMLGALNGKDTFEPLPDIAVGVVLAIPDFPYTTLLNKEVSGFPVWGITPRNRYWLHPAEMKLGKAPVMEGGKLIEKSMMVTAGDYVMVCSGIGGTVEEARGEAYARVQEIELPNSPMYRTDIGCRLEKQLPELQALGYATAWEYK
jgi:phosphoribosylamine--glycine ligase